MTRHLLKLLWNRKRRNALLIVEIFFTFLVLFTLGASAALLRASYARPLGYEWRPVWNLSLEIPRSGDDDWSPEEVARVAQVLGEIRRMPEIEAVAGALSAPFHFGGSNRTWVVDGREISMGVNEVTDELREVFDLRLVEGRWFEGADDALGYRPVVINLELRRALFGAGEAIGHRFDPDPGASDQRVVGVIDDFREDGELSAPGPYAMFRKQIGNPEHRPPRNLLMRLAPDAPADLEFTLATRLRPLLPGWSFSIERLSEARDSMIRLRIAPLLLGALVAGSMLLMVALGLVGVVWQSVTQRRREIGLRRAVGASVRDIQRQFLSETALVATIGIGFGLLLVSQLRAIGLIAAAPAAVWLEGAAFAALAIYAISVLSSLYPSHLASRIDPVEALRYE